MYGNVGWFYVILNLGRNRIVTNQWFDERNKLPENLICYKKEDFS